MFRCPCGKRLESALVKSHTETDGQAQGAPDLMHFGAGLTRYHVMTNRCFCKRKQLSIVHARIVTHLCETLECQGYTYRLVSVPSSLYRFSSDARGLSPLVPLNVPILPNSLSVPPQSPVSTSKSSCTPLPIP
jgi:hypothetical protein